MKRVLVLRPEPGASETVERARAFGLEAIRVPLFEIQPVEWTAPDPAAFDGLLLTSANALRFGSDELEKLRALPVYAVGEATAEAARKAGFIISATGDSGIVQLLGSISPNLRLVHLCGADRKTAAGAAQAITAIVVYRAMEIDAPELASAAGTVALIHSPRAGRRFAELVARRGAISIAAISPAAAEAAGVGWKSVAAAERPTDEALLALAATLCNNG